MDESRKTCIIATAAKAQSRSGSSASRREEGEQAMPTKVVDCPVCGTAMQKRIVRDGIELDYCDWHGVWLDAGELERLFALQGGGQPARQPGIGKAVAQGLAGAAVMGAGFHLGGRLVDGVLDALFNRRA